MIYEKSLKTILEKSLTQTNQILNDIEILQ